MIAILIIVRWYLTVVFHEPIGHLYVFFGEIYI